MKTKNTVLQNILEIFSILTLAGLGAFILIFWNTLPEKVPLHYGLTGEIDRWGSKYELLVLPVITIVMYLLLTVISQLPRFWNMAVEPTPENKEALYSQTKTMLLWLKLQVVLIFCYLTYTSVRAQPLSIWYLPIVLVVVFGTIAYYIYKQRMADRYTKQKIKIDSEVTRLKKTFPVSKYWLIVPVLLMVLPFLFALGEKHGNALFYAFLFCIDTLSFCIMYFFAAATKSKFFSENPDLNMALNRLRIKEWTRFWVLAAYVSALGGVICFSILQAHQYTLTIMAVVFYIVHVVAVLVLSGIIRARVANTMQILLEGYGDR